MFLSLAQMPALLFPDGPKLPPGIAAVDPICSQGPDLEAWLPGMSQTVSLAANPPFVTTVTLTSPHK